MILTGDTTTFWVKNGYVLCDMQVKKLLKYTVPSRDKMRERGQIIKGRPKIGNDNMASFLL
jgi:hypothetical protein